MNRAKESLKIGDLDFSRLESLVLTQDGHTRRVYRYSDMLAPENVICQCLKQLLDKVFRVRYPNRNKMVKTLFNTLLFCRLYHKMDGAQHQIDCLACSVLWATMFLPCRFQSMDG